MPDIQIYVSVIPTVHLLLLVAASKCLRKQPENVRVRIEGVLTSINLLEFSNVCFKKKNRKTKYRVRIMEIKDSQNYPAVE